MKSDYFLEQMQVSMAMQDRSECEVRAFYAGIRTALKTYCVWRNGEQLTTTGKKLEMELLALQHSERAALEFIKGQQCTASA